MTRGEVGWVRSGHGRKEGRDGGERKPEEKQGKEGKVKGLEGGNEGKK